VNKLAAILDATRDLQPPDGASQGRPMSRATWEEAVGSRIGRRTQPVRLERRVLYVRVSSAAWANELSLLSEDIRQQLLVRGIEVDSLRFSVGRLDRERHSRIEAPRQGAPRDAPLPARLAAHFAELDDDDLTRAMRAAAASTLWLNDPKRE
jgi:hypothetical protein